MENILINFASGDQSGLSDAASGLDKIIQKEGAVGEAWQKTSEQMNVQNKSTVDQTNKLAKSIDQLAVASKSMDKVVIGGAYKNYLKQIQDQLGLTNKEVIAYIQNARKAAQEAIFSAKDSQEAKELSLTIEVMNDQLKELGVTETGTAEKTQSLRARIREAKEELVAMAEAGLQGTPAFVALQNKAGELDDQMRDLNDTIKNTGSDTKNIDGVISLMSGVAGGYAVAQGAAALFGDENEDLQKALLKVNAAMSILQGLQQIQMVLQKESAASVFLNTTARKAETVAIEGAEIAQEGLNTTMKANPVGLVIVGVTALITALSLYKSSEDKSAEATKKLNDLLSEQYSLNSDLNNIYPTLNQKLKENLDLQLKILAATDAPAAEQLKKKQEIAAVSKEIAQQEVDRLKKENGALEDNQKELDGITRKLLNHTKIQAQIQKLNGELVDKGMDITAAQAGAINAQIQALEKLPEISKKSVEALKSDQTRINKIVSDQKAAQETLTNSISETSTLSAEDLRKQYTDGLKSASAFSDALIAENKLVIVNNNVDSIASIKAVSEAEISAIKAKRNEELKSNNNLTPGEIAKINADANLAIAENKKQLQLEILNIEKSGIDAQLILSKKGSQEEYDLKIEQINKEQQIELSAIKITGKSKEQIDASAFKKREDAERAFNESQLQNAISRDNALLSNFLLTEKQKLPLVIERLNDQEKLEISAADKNTSKILEIKAKYDAQRLAAEKSAIEAQLALELKELEVYGQKAKILNQQIVSNPLGNADRRIIANNDLQIAEQKRIDKERVSLKNELDNKVISYQDYYLKLKELQNQEDAINLTHSQNSVQIFKDKQDKMLAMIQSAMSVIQNGIDNLDASGLKTGLTEVLGLFNKIKDAVAQNAVVQKAFNEGIATQDDLDASKRAERDAIITGSIMATQATLNQVFADASAQRQQQMTDELQALDDQKNKELDNKNLTEKQKAEIDKRYADKEKQVKINAFKADLEAKKEEAIVNGFLAVTNALATVHPFIPAGLIAAGIAAANTAIQVSAISRTKVPKFRHGVVDIQGPGTSTSDSIPAMLSKGETIIPAETTAKWKDALIALKDNHFENYLSQKFKDFFPNVPEDVLPETHGYEINYKQLAIEVANEMKGIIPAPAQIFNTMDERGIHSFVKKGNTRTEIKNERYSMT